MTIINLAAVTFLTSLRPQFWSWQFCIAILQVRESVIAASLAI
jgi:hypothetical protein